MYRQRRRTPACRGDRTFAPSPTSAPRNHHRGHLPGSLPLSIKVRLQSYGYIGLFESVDNCFYQRNPGASEQEEQGERLLPQLLRPACRVCRCGRLTVMITYRWVTSIRLLGLLFGYRVSVRTVLHATRQRWYSSPYPSRSWHSI